MDLIKKIQNYNMDELKKIAEKMELPVKKSKKQMVEEIMKAMKEYTDYKKEKIDRYTKISQLGDSGKEGTTHLVYDNKGEKELAMKCFRKAKSSRTLKKEYAFLRKAGKAGISPRAIDYDTVSKYIVMEKMDSHLYHELKKTKKLKKKHQLRILEIFSKLDELKIFHNDANLLNYMLKDGTVYLIDFGFAREINDRLIKGTKTEKPNTYLMTIGLIKKLKELNLEKESYKYLLKALPKEYIESYNL